MTHRPLPLAATLLLVSGCLSHMPPAHLTHMQIHWQHGYDAAVQESAATGKPILAVLAAGRIDGLC